MGNPAETSFTYAFSIYWIKNGILVSIYQSGEQIERPEKAVFSLRDPTGVSERGLGGVSARANPNILAKRMAAKMMMNEDTAKVMRQKRSMSLSIHTQDQRKELWSMRQINRQRTGARRILYIDCYTRHETSGSKVPSSMSIGYGITAGGMIRRSLEEHDFELIRPLADTEPYDDGSRVARLRWVLRGYKRIADAVADKQPDLVFVFHSFSAFPVEIRRILLELGSMIPIIGYTHGSHWDPSDLVRLQHYPGLEMLDLANLLALDRILFDSEFMKRTVTGNIENLNAEVARAIDQRSCIVGLPLDTDFIDSCRPTRSFHRTTIVFNHAPVEAKGPREFIKVAEHALERFDINVMFTRTFDDGDPGASDLRDLRRRFGDRVILGNDMPLRDYFEALWMSDIQVSTAHHESLGVATLEAMYTENCCLLPSRGSYPEICSGNRDVLYNSTSELEERLAFFITGPDRRRSVGQVLALEARNHSAAKVMPRILSVVEDVLEVAHVQS